jgi:hypothetical protein
MLKTKEHYELMDEFEKEYSHRRLAREDKDMWPRGAVYQDGATNELFRAYRQGYAFGIAKQY